MMPAKPERRSHDDVRHATTILLAALDMATGTVIGSLQRRHRASEFIAAPRAHRGGVPDDPQAHLILDSYSTHEAPEVRRWLETHPRLQLHLTPTSGSRLNMVERWLDELTTKKVRRGAHTSVGAPRAGYPRVDPAVGHRATAVRLGQDRRCDPGIACPVLQAGVGCCGTHELSPTTSQPTNNSGH